MTDFFLLLPDVLIDAVKDTLYLVLFLFLTYLVMEWLEHKTSEKSRRAVQRAGVAGPAVGALLGVVPQCGFSAAASTFYAGRVITLGTLFAVYLSTSDEMLPIFIAEQVPLGTILAILLTKVAVGMAVGFGIDGVLRFRQKRESLRIHELCEKANCFCEERCSGNAPEAGEHCGEQGHGHHHHHDETECEHQHGSGSIVLSALKHTLQIALFVFVISFVLNMVLELAGEDALASFVAQNEVLSVVASALVGLIPNCAASVAIAQLYVEGVLGAGAMMAGLLVGAGVGLLVLVRTNRGVKENIFIILGLVLTGIAVGMIISLAGIVF